MLFQTAGRWNCLLFVQMNLEAKMQTFTEQFEITNILVHIFEDNEVKTIVLCTIGPLGH